MTSAKKPRVKASYKEGFEDAIRFINCEVGAHQTARELVPLMETKLISLLKAYNWRSGK